jgi:hypothetical protein
LYWSDWVSGNGTYCVGQSNDGTGQFPSALKVPLGERRVRIRFFKPQRPSRLKVLMWRAVGPGGGPVGDADELDYDLRAQRREGGTIFQWRAVVNLNVVGDRYLSVSAFWRDTDGCGGTQGLAERFHLRGLPGAEYD